MFPPYMKKAPLRLTSNGLWEKNDLNKIEDSIAILRLRERFFATFRVPDIRGNS